MIRLMKTGTYWVCHITVACSLAFLITGSWRAALAIGLLEPSVQAVVFYLHEAAWDRAQCRSGATAATELAVTSLLSSRGAPAAAA